MTIHVTVATVIQDQDRFLVVRESSTHRPNRIVINQPAGHVELGERLVDAAIRETLEETGWLCAIKHCIGVYHYLSPNSHRQYLRTCFAAEVIRQEHPGPLDDTILSAEWMPLNEITAIHEAAQLHTMQHTIHPTTHSTIQATKHPATKHPATKSGNSVAPKVALRSSVVLECIHDFLKGHALPWHCVKESKLSKGSEPPKTQAVALRSTAYSRLS